MKIYKRMDEQVERKINGWINGDLFKNGLISGMGRKKDDWIDNVTIFTSINMSEKMNRLD